MKKLNAVIFLIIIFSFLSCTRYIKKDNVIPAGQVNGKAVYQNKGIRGARIYVYQKSEIDFSLSLIAVSLPADENGNIPLELNPGMYYFMARKTDNPVAKELKKNDYFGYFGGNPVKVSQGNPVELTINCVVKNSNSSEAVSVSDGEKPGISGTVYYDNEPLDRAEIFVYLNMENDLRGPAYFSTVTDEKGEFYAPLESGTYYLVCRKRAGPDQFGPIQPGDFFGYYEANPVSLRQNEHQNIVMFALQKEVSKGSQNIVTPSGMTGVDKTFISGKVYDLNRDPVGGVFVCLYKEVEMVGKPDYISNKTTQDGSFRIALVSGGKYYLIAKENFGAIPQPNDFIGYLSDSKDHSFEIITDKKLDGLEVIGEKILSR